MTKLFPAHICLWTFGILRLPTELEGILKRTPPHQPTGDSAGFASNPFICVFEVRPFYGAVFSATEQSVGPMPLYARSIALCRSLLKTRPAMVKDAHEGNRLQMTEELCLAMLAKRLTMLSLQRAGF